MTSSSGQTFQITGTSVGGKVVTTKLSVPANSKIVTVNVPTSQGGTAALRFTASVFMSYYLLWASLTQLYASLSVLFTGGVFTTSTQTRGAAITSLWYLGSKFVLFRLKKPTDTFIW